MKKSELRTLYLERRSSFTVEQISDASQKIAHRFFASVDLSGVRRLHCFIPIEKFREINTMPIFQGLWRNHPAVETFAPRSNLESCEIESVRFFVDSAVTTNRWGISEPVDAGIVEPASIDMVLVPLLCFDKRGHRLGYGRGFYDRFLAETRESCIKIGLSIFPPIETIDDIDQHDVTLDLFVTQDELVQPTKYLKK